MSGINQTRAIPAGTHAVWCGDSVTQGTGASATAKRYSTLASGELNLTEHNYAKTNAGYLIDGNTISMQLDAANADAGYPHDQVGYVFLMAGLTDSYESLANMQQTVADTIAKAKRLFPVARIVVGVGPGCIPDATDAEAIARQGHVLTAITLAGTSADALVIHNMRAICGSDHDMHATGINPNDEGMRLLAQAVVTSVDADKGEPLDTPVTDLTQAQGLQQVILQQQQEQLAEQQRMLKEQQDQFAAQQKQLKSVQDQQASMLSTLQSQQTQLGQMQSNLENSIRSYINTNLVPTLNANFAKVDDRFDKLEARVGKLEQGTPA